MFFSEKAKNYFVYILKSQKNGKFYIGSTGNLERRVEIHNQGFSLATKSAAPWDVVYFELFESKTEALKREKAIKRRKSRVYIENLIGSRSSVG